ncbi:Vps5 C terminal like-domain-containing protein, partial [Protomyces lactucae-debilis]
NNRFKQPVKQYFLRIFVTAIERAAKKDPIIRLDAQTNLPGFRTTQFRDIRRTHHELEKLADHLVIQNPECMVPALYPAVSSFGAGTEEDERRYKLNVQHWLNLICSNLVLIRDSEVVHFIEADFGWSPVMNKGKPATGIKRRAIKQLQPPPDDCHELANARPLAKQFYLLAQDSGSKLKAVIKSRRHLSLAEQDFGQLVGHLAVGETHSGMANAFLKLGRVLQAVSDAHSAHATLEAGTLGDALFYHASDAYVVKETLTTRHFLIRELNQAQNASITKTANMSRMKSSASIASSKVDEALASLEEAKALEQSLTAKLNRVTGNLLQENRRWQTRTSTELKVAMQEYVRKQIESERRILAVFESCRPDIRSIDQSGGLSRLGREKFQRLSSQGPSQTAEGDAWSGVKR